jgi:hypothetical protein
MMFLSGLSKAAFTSSTVIVISRFTEPLHQQEANFVPLVVELFGDRMMWIKFDHHSDLSIDSSASIALSSFAISSV